MGFDADKKKMFEIIDELVAKGVGINVAAQTALVLVASKESEKPVQGQDPCEETFETKQSDLNKIYGICVHPACRHKDAEIQLLNKELEITKKLLYIATGEVNNQADKNEKLKNRLAEADDLLNNPNTITIDRKVAERFAKFFNGWEMVELASPTVELLHELKRALGEKI